MRMLITFAVGSIISPMFKRTTEVVSLASNVGVLLLSFGSALQSITVVKATGYTCGYFRHILDHKQSLR